MVCFFTVGWVDLKNLDPGTVNVNGQLASLHCLPVMPLPGSPIHSAVFTALMIEVNEVF